MRRLSSSVFPKTHHFPPYKSHQDNLFFFPAKKHSVAAWAQMSTTSAAARRHKKIVVIMGPTGCGKSKLSVDLASRFFPSSEIVNSDKIQVYRGLDITTNKIPVEERKNVRHHLLGEFDATESHPELTPADFRARAASVISQILLRRRVPFVVGGSNSFIYALLAKRFDPETDVFSEAEESAVFCKELRYSCCFLWVDVSLPVLNRHLIKRVDDMLDSGMFEELAEYFSSPESEKKCGMKKAIGVPEFERYFKRFPQKDAIEEEEERRVEYEEAVRAIKDNTCQLAKRQLGKILRLRELAGWDVKRVDATAVFRAAMEGRRVAEIWERQVVEPSVKIVKQFLME